MKHRGFTLIELLIVIAIVAALAGIAYPLTTTFIGKSREAACLNNLRALGVGLQTYVQEHNERLPVLEAGRKFKSEDIPVLDTVLLPYFESPEAFKYPADKEKYESTGSSYLWNSTQSGQLISQLVSSASRIALIKSRSSPTRKPGTSLGIILGMVMPDGGDVTIDGISVSKNRSQALQKVGAVFESPAFYDYLSGWENLKILMSYSSGFDAKSAREVIEQVGLTKRVHSKVRTYSHGMRQRLALAQALLPSPEVLLLDESTDGLDPEGIKWFRDFILNLRNERGMTALFNSHLLAEVELMCDRVAILREGKRVFEGTIGDLHDDALVFDVDLEPWPLACGIIAGSGGEVRGPNRICLRPDPSLVRRLIHGNPRRRRQP